MKYLVCVDGSENADVAFHRALNLFNKDHDELLVMFVHSDPKEPHKREHEKTIIWVCTPSFLSTSFSSSFESKKIKED